MQKRRTQGSTAACFCVSYWLLEGTSHVHETTTPHTQAHNFFGLSFLLTGVSFLAAFLSVAAAVSFLAASGFQLFEQAGNLFYQRRVGFTQAHNSIVLGLWQRLSSTEFSEQDVFGTWDCVTLLYAMQPSSSDRWCTAPGTSVQCVVPLLHHVEYLLNDDDVMLAQIPLW